MQIISNLFWVSSKLNAHKRDISIKCYRCGMRLFGVKQSNA
ncbi:hypothetical protein PNIG_a0516 [Pseudoalteromonas nigrifaciens]|uniref:Uncharacterized protein n=1 Tax=Pseudoalteromonas nigrifaciens TaxID=28109 RepID=A0AAC9UHD4_9GAMM|nr:hypothetical protein PNIG_a0516 [Pseudoalteromonas nigrifaciens]